eukprot:SAG11_NODE_4940_length_1716_cov_2.717378_2_plen_48_part_00
MPQWQSHAEKNCKGAEDYKGSTAVPGDGTYQRFPGMVTGGQYKAASE